MLETIYIVRHGYRSNWTVDPKTGTYATAVPTPTGIPSDPALASYGVVQSEQLATHLLSLDPAPDLIVSSPYYRCLQTLAPYVTHLARPSDPKDPASASPVSVTVEPGIGEFYGRARFTHPGPGSLEVLSTHFPHLRAEASPTIVPAPYGESIPMLHDRVAYCLTKLIARADADRNGPKAILLCTHAAAIIAMGRVLTGRMPEEVGEEDFGCFTCGVSTFRRRGTAAGVEGVAGEGSGLDLAVKWDPAQPDEVPDVGWRGGKGVGGGWECVGDSDCSFLDGGEERGWNFHMEAERIAREQAKEDAMAAAGPLPETPTTESKLRAATADKNGNATSEEANATTNGII